MRCFNCMKKIPDKASFCPYCGKNVQIHNPSHCLSSGTVLNDRYEVGAVIGEGGFGITYTGYDQVLELKVAIKEFYPTGIANRNNTVSSKIVLTTSKHTGFYQNGKQRFLDEARNIARFSDEDGIVDVRDHFTENDTAYIVMEYLDGVDLREYLNTNGTIPARNAFEMMLPLMRALEKMHKQGIIHRDIAPDNIMRLDNGKLKLTDFGSARCYLRDEAKTMSIFLKQGYSPIEQLGSKSAQGPWTDVYSLCATIYQCITGTVPPNSLDRSVLDELKTPSELGFDIPSELEDVLMKGLAVKSADRLQDMEELINAADAEQINSPQTVDTQAEGKPLTDSVNIPQNDPQELTKSADDSDSIFIYESPAKDAPVNEPIAGSVIKTENADTFQRQPAAKKAPRKRNAGFIVGIILAGTAVLAGLIALPIYFMQQNKDSGTSGSYSETQSADASDSKQTKLSVKKTATTVSAGENHLAGLKTDGTVIAIGKNEIGQCDTTDWSDIVTISGSGFNTVGVKSDGTAVATGYNKDGQCNVEDWKNLSDISAAWWHTVGLKKNGKVVATGLNDNGQCNVGDWSDIADVSAGCYHTLGLHSDGTVSAAGSNKYKQCDVGSWKDIVAVSAGDSHTVGLKSDGTVTATGYNEDGACNVGDWKDIVAISAGRWHTVGLKSDGTVVAAGLNNAGQCNVSNWKDIVAVSAGTQYTVGLKSDGTLVTVGKNDNGQCNVSDWKDIKLP